MDSHVAPAQDRAGLLDRVFHASAVGMVVARLDDGRIQEANDRFCSLMGVGLGEVLGADVYGLDLWGALGPDRARGRLAQTGLIDGFDTSVSTREGETRVIRLWAEVVNGGEPLVVVRASDVDGRAAAGSRYRELRETEMAYRALVEQMPAITYTQVEEPTSPTGFRNLYISPQTERILGYTPEEWQADPELWVRATHPDDRDQVVAQDHWSATTGDRFLSEYRMIARDGRVVWFRDEAVLITDPVSRVRFWQGMMLDVTEMKESAEHHAETEAKYRTLVESLPCVVYLAKYGDDGDWLYVSPQIERVLGFTPTEWMEHPHPQASFTHPDDLEMVREAEVRSQREGVPFRIEYRMQRRDGEWVWLLDEATAVLDDEGNPICLQGLMYDITERRGAEERLVALDRLKNTLLHTLSHDLKEPLTAILGAASTLERLDDQLDEEERTALLHTLGARTKAMNGLLTDLLDLDRLDSGITEPRRFPVDLVELVSGLVERTVVLRGRKVEVEPGRCIANVDVPKVERMIENLLANAVRHTGSDARIWARCRREGGGAVIIVDDDGPGVPAGFEETVFEAFRRGPGTEGTQGSGIGLSLVARFAELHGGRAWVEERPDGGASFRVYLPDGPIGIIPGSV